MNEKKLLENIDAPYFEIKINEDEFIKLTDYKGKWLVLYFYPKDNTPGCTVEAKDFSNLKQEFKELNTEILGISKDSLKSHKKFIDKQELTINLGSDEETVIHKLYKSWGMKKNYGKEYEGVIRSTFLINPEGIIVKHWHNVRAKGHAERVLKFIKEL